MFNSAIGITPTADLSVVIDASATVPDVGDVVEVEARIDNIGPHTATELRLAMALPTGLELASATPSSGTCELAAEITCEFDELPSGSSATLDLSFVAGTRGTWPLAAKVSSWEIDPEPTHDSAEIVVEAIPHADVSVAMAARDMTVSIGEIMEIDYTISNAGPQTAQGTVVSFTIPARTTVSVPSGCRLEGELLICEVPDIPATDTWEDTLVLHAAKTGSAPITATVEPQEDDHDVADNTVAANAFILPQFTGPATGGAGSGFTLLMLLAGCLVWRLTSQRT
jgi:uncharacterized repeat protein (TIGR01451 family)